MKGKDYLRDMASQLNPMNAILNMAKPMIPMFKEKIRGYNKPESEGGVLQEGEDHAMLSLNPLGKRIRIDVITYKIIDGKMMVSRFIPLDDFNRILDGK